MTPYTLTAPSPQTTTPPPAAKDNTREAKRNSADSSSSDNSSRSSKSSDKSTLTENKQDISSTDTSLFSELMASLLYMPAPAQTPPTVTVKPVANDGTASALNIVSDPNVQAGAAFSMDPALLVIPQDTPPATLSTTTDGSFSAELLAALTPGTPAPVADETIASVPQLITATNPTAPVITVPVPVATGETTEALTVNTDTPADPRLIAAGFDPAQMSALKDKITKHAEPAANTNSQTAPQASVQTKDGGVITVTFTPEKPVVQPQSITTSSNAAVVVATQVTPTTTTPPPSGEVIVQAAQTGMTEAVKDEGSTTLLETAKPTEGETTANDTSFDPVEFRIAQRFQRPVSQPSGEAQPAPATTSAADKAPVNAPTSNASQQHTVNGKAKMAANTETATTIPSSTLLASTTSSDGLTTANPSALPLNVTTIASSPVVQNVTATQSHPAVQTVAAIIAKNAKETGVQTISLRLDPPELGKLQVQMKYKKGDPLKVHVVLEKADTASMFQRDAHALESALNDAGLQTDGSSLTFEFSQDGNAFKQAMGQESSGSQGQPKTETLISETAPIETSLDVFTDNKTGLTHYNLRV